MKKLFCVLLLCIAWGTSAQTLDDAYNAYRQEDYKTASSLYEQLATKGDAKAQLELGLMFRHGIGVTKNYSEALSWLGKASNQGSADAQHAL